MTAALEGGEWSAARPGRTLPPGKTRYPFYRRLGGSQSRSGRAKNLVPTGIRSRTVQPVETYINTTSNLKIDHHKTQLYLLCENIFLIGYFCRSSWTITSYTCITKKKTAWKESRYLNSMYRGADNSLALPGRKQANFLSEWREFPSAPCLGGKKNLMTARV